MSLPVIKKFNDVDTLFVHDVPFIALAGEIHNSSASNLKYMEEHVWANINDLNLNSIIVPIYWELIEPIEGSFDFSLIDGIISQARDNKMHLILLWFGLWKNSESMYVPAWMKKDSDRFFYSRKINGEVINTISPLCVEAVEKDMHALSMVMSHIKTVDEIDNTVIVIQIENEIGLLGTDRDYCSAANEEFYTDIPDVVKNEFNVTGTWREAFSDEAEEHFMAYHFAKAIEKITQTAKAQYNLPCYANAWLKQHPWYPGSYPIGGPVASMKKMWKLIAPSLFCLAPDIYVSYVPQVMDEYAFNGNPLFIPEVRKDAVTASYALYAFGKHNAICYSPFGIEDLALNESEIDKPPMAVMMALNIDPSAFETDGSIIYLSEVYRFFKNAKETYFKFRGTPELQCYLKKSETDFGDFLKFKKYNITVDYEPKMSHKPIGAGIIIELNDNTFYTIGLMSQIRFLPKPGERGIIKILSMQEGYFENEKWIGGRMLNGDEKMSVHFKDILMCYKIEVIHIQ